MKPQAETLTDKQINSVYSHFHRGTYIPRDVEMKATFRETMGRKFVGTKTGVRAYAL